MCLCMACCLAYGSSNAFCLGNRTADPKQVKRWHKEWLAGELFENLPCDGIVVKVASGECKNRLGSNSKCPNWAIAMKD